LDPDVGAMGVDVRGWQWCGSGWYGSRRYWIAMHYRSMSKMGYKIYFGWSKVVSALCPHWEKKTSSYGYHPTSSNQTLGVHTNKLKSQTKNYRDDKCRGWNSNLQLLQEIGDILVNSGKNALIMNSYQPSLPKKFQWRSSPRMFEV
jgi:hypothetical protein